MEIWTFIASYDVTVTFFAFLFYFHFLIQNVEDAPFKLKLFVAPTSVLVDPLHQEPKSHSLSASVSSFIAVSCDAAALCLNKSLFKFIYCRASKLCAQWGAVRGGRWRS